MQHAGLAQPEQVFQCFQPCLRRRFWRRRAQQQPGAFTTERHTQRKRQRAAQALDQLAQLLFQGQHLALGQPGQRQQSPRQLHLGDLDRGVLQLRLLRLRAIGGRGQCVDARCPLAFGVGAPDVLVTPVHRDEALHRRHLRAGTRRQDDLAAARTQLHQVAGRQPQAQHVMRVHVHTRFRLVAEQAPQRAGAAHAVPLVAQTAGVQRVGIAGVARLGHGLIGGVGEAGFAVGRGVVAIFIEPRPPGAGAFGKRPLRGRLLEPGVVQPGDVQVAAARRFAVLVPHRAGIVIRKQRGGTRAQPGRGFRLGVQTLFKPAREIDTDVPVVAGLARRINGRSHAADAALAVGDGAVLLAPRGGRQQHVGAARGGGGGVGLLHDDKFTALERAAHRSLVGHRLRRVRAGDPQRLDLPVGRGLEHLDRALARRLWHLIDLPQPGHFGAVLGVGQVAVGAQCGGQPADLAATHRVGLPGQRERTGAGLADLPTGQMQVDQRRVLRGAAAALIQTLAVQRQRGAALRGVGAVQSGKPAGGLHQVGFGDAAEWRHCLRCAVAHPVAQGLEAVGVCGDVGRVGQAFPQHQVQHAVEQRHVGAWQDLQEQIGRVGGFGAARVDDDQAQPGACPLGVLDAAEQDRVRERGIRAGDEQRVGVVQVVVAGGR